MPEFIALTCPQCNAKLKITEDIDRFSCAHCGTELIVIRQEGIVALKPVLEKISRDVDTAAKETGSTASELAIVRLDREISAAARVLSKLEGKRITSLFIGGFGLFLLIFGVIVLVSDFGIMEICKDVAIIYFIFGIPLVVIGISQAFFSLRKRMKCIEDDLNQLNIQRKQHYDRVRKIS